MGRSEIFTQVLHGTLPTINNTVSAGSVRGDALSRSEVRGSWADWFELSRRIL